jgi:hypothetical protein
MADLKSSTITSLTSDPALRVDPRVNGGRARTKVAFYTFDGTQSDDDVVRFFRISSGAVINGLWLNTVASITGMTDVDFGLHDINDGDAVDVDLFDAAQTMAANHTDMQKRYGGDSALDITSVEKTVWELLGLSEDPQKEYDVTATLATAGSASGTCSLRMEYSAGD